MFRIAAIIGIVGSLIIIGLHLVMRSARKDEPVEPSPPGAPGKYRKLIYLLIYLAVGGSFAILALSGFIAAIGWGGPMQGYLLMLHCTVAPVFCIALVALGCIWAERCRFKAEDWQNCTALCVKLCFWSTLVFGIPLIFSIVISMLPIFGTCGQEFFYHLHRWSALVIVITGVLMFYLTFVSRPCSNKT
jgi:hypothetical protein